MSKDSFNRLIERLNQDPHLHVKMKEDPEGALEQLGLSQAEYLALSTGDEDSLRRLPGLNEDAMEAGIRSWITRNLCTAIFCGHVTRNWKCPKDPGSPNA